MTDPGKPPVSDRPPAPRWLKLLVTTGLLILVLVIVITLLTGVSHGPGMHGA